MGTALKLDCQHEENTVSAIEAGFPHVAKRLCECWGEPECVTYLDNLLTYSNWGNSKGFPGEVVEELFSLYMLRFRDPGAQDVETASGARH